MEKPHRRPGQAGGFQVGVQRVQCRRVEVGQANMADAGGHLGEILPVAGERRRGDLGADRRQPDVVEVAADREPAGRPPCAAVGLGPCLVAGSLGFLADAAAAYPLLPPLAGCRVARLVEDEVPPLAALDEPVAHPAHGCGSVVFSTLSASVALPSSCQTGS
jgi:hypothetical protein